MSQQEKAHYFNALKNAGVQFDKHYREYKTDELKAAYDKLAASQPPQPAPAPTEQPTISREEALRNLEAQRQALLMAEMPVPPEQPPVRPADPDELPGQRQNTGGTDVPIRTDEMGRVWFQEEVLKPGYAKPRGRRVLRTNDAAAVTTTVQEGQYTESFEIAGDGPKQATEIKITMPSYQTGIYKDPRYPFRVHTYNGDEGFDFFEVAEYYGGVELVPPSIKRKYVENVLCFDMRTTVQTIQAEFRHLQLTGRIKA